MFLGSRIGRVYVGSRSTGGNAIVTGGATAKIIDTKYATMPKSADINSLLQLADFYM